RVQVRRRRRGWVGRRPRLARRAPRGRQGRPAAPLPGRRQPAAPGRLERLAGTRRRLRSEAGGPRPMKRLLAIVAVVVAAVALLVVATGAASGDDPYRVRAIFDNAGFLVPGEDVKVAGVVIGTIESLEVTKEKKAAIVLRIDDPAFRDFKRDASCQVRVQSLLGEKFVSCRLTQPTSGSDPRAKPPLRRIEDGPNKGQYLLPVEQTSSSVDLDLMNNIMRLPERQRFALILNEFGTGLAGNGDELRAAIRRANPALDQMDRFIRILA